MRIAIVGGGASGLVAAHLLGRNHEVHLFERAPNFGGHVRTLGLNVQAANLPPGIVTENGPLGFHIDSSPTFMGLLRELQVEIKPSAFGTNLVLQNGQTYYLAPDLKQGYGRFFNATTGGWRAGLGVASFLFKTRKVASGKIDEPLERFLPRSKFLRDWLRCLTMLSYSTPLAGVDALPGSIAVPILRDGILRAAWAVIPGGVYSYQAKILEQFGGQAVSKAQVDRIFRDAEGVHLSVNGRSTSRFDKLVIATPPGVVLSMLDSPTPIEARFFSSWKPELRFRTMAHADPALYRDHPLIRPTVGDVFQRGDGDFGYNCCVSSVLDGSARFHFAYHLDDWLNPSTVVDSHDHLVPAYSVAGLKHRQSLLETNGSNHTYYAGAWLGEGLHESAITSAYDVARCLEASRPTQAHRQ